MEKNKLGVSACLLGMKVRYDGGHKLDRYLTGTLARFVDFVPVCPEAECGLGVPREASRLVGDTKAPRFVTVQSGRDLTERLTSWADQKVRQLDTGNLSGFIFKSNSPSCAVARVKVSGEQGRVKKGAGLFARAFMDHFPLLPVEDEVRLHDPDLRENFFERVFTLRRWREMAANKPDMGRLVDFHTRHRLVIMAHSPRHLRLSEQLAGHGGKEISPSELYDKYLAGLMEALHLKTTIKKNVRVLTHLLGYFKKKLSPDEKQELLEVIEDYRQGYTPLIVPVTLFNHYARIYRQLHLSEQYYLRVDPVELRLKNHA